MTEFDKPLFEQLMGEAVALHNQGQYEDSLVVSTEAYEMAPEDSFEKGRAARDIGARFDRLGRPDKAEVWGMEAFTIHDEIVRSMDSTPTREAYRERSVSAMYVGVNGLRNYINALKDPYMNIIDKSEALSYLRITLSDLSNAEALAPEGINQEVDQYEINAARRISIGETLLGDRKKGLQIGKRAVKLAFMSESPKLDTSNPNLNPKQRTRAKVKALLGGVAAVGVNVLSSPKVTNSRKLALKIASKAL